MVFTDDPAMNDYWRKWAIENEFPLLTLHNATPYPISTIEIKLNK